jgi:aryl-alcohol dehydrogenase-like predicted oxidoreductase
MSAKTIKIGGELEVGRLGFGAMRITGPGIWGPPRDKPEALRVLRRAIELGVRFIDTADCYGPEISELLIAEALHPYPEGLVIATKGGYVHTGPDEWVVDCRPERLRRAIDDSLRRLRLERIDLYQLHAIDPAVPLEDSLGALADAQREGRVRFVGVSNFSVEDLARAERVVEVVSVQNRYGRSDRTSEPVLQACEKKGIAFIPWSPLWASADGRPASPVDNLVWLLRHSPVILPIPGTSCVAHLEENMRAAELA